jgi:arylsulfatase A-like enzyme
MKTPRIILVVVDTLRADFLGCYGGGGGLTPAIDALSARGARFENAYSASNFTAPAVASLFTSLYPARHGIYDFRIKRLPPSRLMAIAKRHGCVRKAVVDFGFFKSFLGASFDDMESLRDFTVNWSTEGPEIETRRAIEWVGAHRDEPFFLYFHISPPHTPYRFPSRYYDMVMNSEAWDGKAAALRAHDTLGTLLPDVEGDRIPDREIERFARAAPRIAGLKIPDDLAEIVRDLYRMEVRVVDDLVGRMVAELDRLGIFEQTILSLSSDHGEELWDHGSFGHGASAMHNEVIRTPWILTCPERISPRVGVESNVSHTNILPTILDVAGLELDQDLRSKSVAGLVGQPAISADGSRGRGGTPVYCDTARWISVVRGDYKLIAPSTRSRFRSRAEKLRYRLSRVKRSFEGKAKHDVALYELRSDPGERHNLAGREKGLAASLRGLAGAYYREAGPISLPGEQGMSRTEEEEIKKELEGLGYM